MSADPAGLRLALALEAEGQLTPTALTLADPGLPWDTYVGLCRMFGRVKRSSSWWLGDTLIACESVYGDKYAQLVEETGLDRGTLMNYHWVCTRIEPDRRVQGLSFSTHEAVAALEPGEQTRWLERAAAEGLSRAELRAELKAAKAEPVREQPQWTDVDGDEVASRRRLHDAVAGVVSAASRDGEVFRVPVAVFETLLAAVAA